MYEATRNKPEQVSCNGVIITYYPHSDQFSIGLREIVRDDGIVLPSRIIPIDPSRIAKSKECERFAEMLETAAGRIKDLAADKQPDADI